MPFLGFFGFVGCPLIKGQVFQTIHLHHTDLKGNEAFTVDAAVDVITSLYCTASAAAAKHVISQIGAFQREMCPVSQI